MTALTVLHNGERVCVAGGDDVSVLAASVSLVRIENLSDSPVLGLIVGGLNAQSQPVSWTMPQLAIGDEVTIRVSDANQTDPPEVIDTADGAG